MATEAVPRVNVPIIDIHPHIIAADTHRYPHAPLGGHQSAWSQKRPVGVEQLIVKRIAQEFGKPLLSRQSHPMDTTNSLLPKPSKPCPNRFTAAFPSYFLPAD